VTQLVLWSAVLGLMLVLLLALMLERQLVLVSGLNLACRLVHLLGYQLVLASDLNLVHQLALG
jgi:hypothetical protein